MQGFFRNRRETIFVYWSQSYQFLSSKINLKRNFQERKKRKYAKSDRYHIDVIHLAVSKTTLHI